jgi:hypothetical protein
LLPIGYFDRLKEANMNGRLIALLLLAMIALQIFGYVATSSISGILIGEVIGLMPFAVIGCLGRRKAIRQEDSLYYESF